MKIVEWMDAVNTDAAKAVPHPAGESDSVTSEAIEEFQKTMNADLNTPGALAPVFTLMNHYYALRTKNVPLYTEDMRQLQNFVDMVRRTFGCFEPEAAGDLPAAVQALLAERAAARTAKDFSESDRLRDAIHKLGYEVRDEKKEQKIKKL